MNTLNLVSRILVASALLVSFSQVTHASAEELSEESKVSVVLTQTMEEEASNSGEEIGLEEEAELLLEDLSEEELKILISQLSDKELLDVEEEATKKVSLTIVIEPALIFLLFTLFLVAVYSFI